MTAHLKTEDLYRYVWVADPQIAPDGQHVVYVRSRAKSDGSGYESDLWLHEVATDCERALTVSGKNHRPRWSPDGRSIAFLSTRAGASADLWLLPVDGGEARRLTEGDTSISEYAWSPTGEHIAFVRAAIHQPPPEEGVRVIRDIPYKFNGRGYTYDRTQQLFVWSKAQGVEHPISQEQLDHGQIAWSAQGTSVAACVRGEKKFVEDSWDLRLYDVTKPGRYEVLVAGFGALQAPVSHPDGTQWFFVGHQNEFFGATLPQLYVVESPDGVPRGVATDFDGTLGCVVAGDSRYGTTDHRLHLASSGGEVMALSTDRGATQIVSFDPMTGTVRPLTEGEWVITEFDYSATADLLVWVAESATQPGELWLQHGGSRRQVTELNPWLELYALSTALEFDFEVDTSETIQSWILPGSSLDSQGRQPMLLQIHGGPHVAYGYGFMHEFHCLSAQGLAVLYSNPRGSAGYGQSFNQASHWDWGGKDYRDLMAAVDHALIRVSTLDETRLGVTGGSFGGYMTNWIIGHTDRFHAALTQRSSCNRYSMFGTGDVGFTNGQWEFPGYPWDNPDQYLFRSPISYVRNVTTPVMILHADDDLRCPVTQAEEWFVALKSLGKEAVLVRFADENHELSRSGRPSRRLFRLNLIRDWFVEHLLD